MANFLIKFVGVPGVIVIAGYLSANINFGNIYQPVIVGLSMGIVGYLMEFLIVKKGLLWMGVAADFFTSVFILYSVANMFPDARVTFWASVVVSAVLAAVEYFVHRNLIESGKVTKSFA